MPDEVVEITREVNHIGPPGKVWWNYMKLAHIDNLGMIGEQFALWLWTDEKSDMAISIQLTKNQFIALGGCMDDSKNKVSFEEINNNSLMGQLMMKNNN